MGTILVTVSDAGTFQRDGSVAMLSGYTESGVAIRFAGDSRLMGDVAMAVAEDGEVEVEVESWQIVGADEYTVEWVINLSADSPQEAARQALLIQRDRTSMATVFSVVGSDGVSHQVKAWTAGVAGDE